MSSTFEVPVISIHLEPHPNADTLSIVKIGGYQCVVKTNEWSEGQLAAYIPPDSVVPDTDEWAWLGTEPRHRRIKVRKFRGVWSHGILAQAPPGSKPGDNVAEALGVVPYEPPTSGREGLSSRDRRALPWYRRIFSYWRELRERPRGQFPYYDIENFRKFENLFTPGESIIVTEKIHGANALYTSKIPWLLLSAKRFLGSIGIQYDPNIKVYMRSRTIWKHPFKRDWWQDAYRNTPGLERLLKDFPGLSIYGEVYGRGVQELEYGVTEPHFVGFDIWEQGVGWWRQNVALPLMEEYGVPTVPVLYEGEYPFPPNISKLSKLAELNGNSKQISEGIVIQSYGYRKILKLINDEYLEKAK